MPGAQQEAWGEVAPQCSRSGAAAAEACLMHAARSMVAGCAHLRPLRLALLLQPRQLRLQLRVLGCRCILLLHRIAGGCTRSQQVGMSSPAGRQAGRQGGPPRWQQARMREAGLAAGVPVGQLSMRFLPRP